MLQELINVNFESGQWPADWIEPQRRYRFERGGLRSGHATSPRVLIPGQGWEYLRVEMDVQPLGGGAVSCGDGTLNTVVDLRRGSHRISYYGPQAMVRREYTIALKQTPYRVTFEYHRGRMRALVDDVEVIAGNDPQPGPAFGLWTLGFHEDCLVHRVRILGDEPLKHPPCRIPPRQTKDFHLEVAVDIVDDLIAAPFTKGMFEQLFAEFASWGVKRCHWLYYGRRSEGWWNHAGWGTFNSTAHAAATMDQIGEIFPAAVQAAHAHGIQLFGLIKPFDMGLYYSYGQGTPEAKTLGKLPYIGGPKPWVANFPAQHRQLIMARKPGVSGPAVNRTFTRIDLVKHDDRPAAFDVNDIQLWVSDDNAGYRPYEGAIKREEVVEDYPVWEHTASGGRPTGETRRSRVMRLSALEIPHQYLALAVPGQAGSFANSLINLVHVFGEQGEERRLTYGLLPRRLEHLAKSGQTPPRTDFRQTGVEFDVAPGNPSGVYPGYDPIRGTRALDTGDGFLALARGKETGPIAVLSPSYPQSRAWWLSWARDCLDEGADGVELRVRAHNYNITWAEFGFEQPVRDEFLRRHGVDLWATDDFDHAAWRRLRGEGYTQLYREARKLAASYGKPMGLHISPTLHMEPEQGGAMDMHWDWRRWLEEGLADTVTFKEIWPGSPLAQEVLSLTRAQGATAVFSPYALGLWGTAGGEKTVAEWIRLARQQGMDGYQFYECAAIVKASSDGRITMMQPALRELFQQEFRKA